MCEAINGFLDFNLDLGANIIAHKQRTGQPITEADKKLLGIPLWTVKGKRQYNPTSTADVADRDSRQEQERRERAIMLAAKVEALGEARLERLDTDLCTLLPKPTER